jgi:hypothetical protein
MSAILRTPEGVPYSLDPETMTALDERHEMGRKQGLAEAADRLSDAIQWACDRPDSDPPLATAEDALRELEGWARKRAGKRLRKGT